MKCPWRTLVSADNVECGIWIVNTMWLISDQERTLQGGHV